MKFNFLLLLLLFGVNLALVAQNDDVQQKLEQARNFINQGQVRQAVNLLEKIPIKGPLETDIRELTGEAYVLYAQKLVQRSEKSEYDIAIKYIDKYKNLYKKTNLISLEKEVALYNQIANELFYNIKDYQSAARIFKKNIKKLIKTDSNNTELLSNAYNSLAQCYLELGNYSAARKQYYKAFGGDTDLKEIADQFYCDRNFIGAARLYRLNKHDSKLVDKKGFDIQIARSYFKANNNRLALDWYSKFLSERDIASLEDKIEIEAFNENCDEALGSPYYYLAEHYEIQDLDIYNYAQALLNESGKYLSAKDLFEKFTFIIEEDPNSLPEKFLEGQTIITKKLTTKGINSNLSSEFSPTFYKEDSVIFVSDRNIDGEKVKTLNGEQRSTLDLYYTDLDSADYYGFNDYHKEVVVDSLVSSTINKFIQYERSKKYNEGPMVFLPGTWEKFIFTGNTNLETKNLSVKNTDEINTLKLFIAEKDSLQNWNVRKLNFIGNEASLFNNDDYSVGHPSLSPDGNKLYFSSDAPLSGSFGNSDLFVADFDIETLELSNVKNLGEKINTEGNEVFPYIHKDAMNNISLYFSSNKPEGIGGLDIYKSYQTEDGWGKPLNMKNEEDTLNTINSSKDDFGFVLNEQGNFGYFSSDRDSTDDIFMFRTLKIEVTVCEKRTGNPLINANVAIFPEVGQRLGTQKTDSTGKTIFSKFSLDASYTAFASFKGYRPEKIDFSTFLSDAPADGVFKLKLCLEKSPEAELIILANVKSEQQIFISFNKPVTELNDDIIIEANNLYELFYSENNNYLVDTDSGPNISLKFFNDQLILLAGMESKENQQKLIDLFDKSGIIIRDIITIRNIRYNFATNEFTKGENEVVNPEEEFTKLATVLDRHNHLLLKISSHTDKCPLDGNYDNLALSRRRNQAARDFITNNFPDYNVDVSRIKECAYTFNYPVDVTYKAPDNCKNDYNRRTEFKLLYRGRESYTMDMICDPNTLEYIGKPEFKTKRKRRRNSDK